MPDIRVLTPESGVLIRGDDSPSVFRVSDLETVTVSVSDDDDVFSGSEAEGVEDANQFLEGSDARVYIDRGCTITNGGEPIEVFAVVLEGRMIGWAVEGGVSTLEPGSYVVTDEYQVSEEPDDETVEPSPTYESLLCFAAGTLIETPEGERPVESLLPGDFVSTLDHGAQPLRWRGVTTVRAAGELAPVVFEPGAFGNRRRLTVSPNHRMLISGSRAAAFDAPAGLLVPAHHLVDGDKVRRQMGGLVSYVHLLFERHEIVISDGALSESFAPNSSALDALSANTRAEILRLFPDLAQSAWPPARPVAIAGEARLLS
ncbi:MAG: Hint domain-containing protein [Pseudomonadota bacterium]